MTEMLLILKADNSVHVSYFGNVKPNKINSRVLYSLLPTVRSDYPGLIIPYVQLEASENSRTLINAKLYSSASQLLHLTLYDSLCVQLSYSTQNLHMKQNALRSSVRAHELPAQACTDGLVAALCSSEAMQPHTCIHACYVITKALVYRKRSQSKNCRPDCL